MRPVGKRRDVAVLEQPRVGGDERQAVDQGRSGQESIYGIVVAESDRLASYGYFVGLWSTTMVN